MNDKQNNNLKESNGVLSQFLLSLIATTISIALTFGVSTLVENRKKEESKREIVLMVMYDMQQSLNMMTECHSKLANFFDAQLDFIANPAKFKEASKTLIQYYPSINFSTTTESIFNSNIETINIVGSAQFVQQVSSFHGFRREYKKSVMDDFNEGSMEMLLSYDNFVSFNTSEYPLISQSLINEMEKIFKQCKMLMNVSDEELTAFTKEQDRLQKAVEDSTFTAKEQQYLRDYSERNQRLKEAIEQGKKKR